MPFHLFWWPHWLCKLRCRPSRHWELVNTNRGLISAFQLSRILTLFFSPWHTNHKQTNSACFQILDKKYALLMFKISIEPSRVLSILFVVVHNCVFAICKSTRLCHQYQSQADFFSQTFLFSRQRSTTWTQYLFFISAQQVSTIRPW